MQSGLTTRVLKDVSRSFYLSLRFLPAGFREPAGLGYLLARLSDTIADAGDEVLARRRELLERFVDALYSGERDWILGLDGLKGVTEGEEVLLKRTNDCLDALASLPEWQQAAIRRVVGIITEGQDWDLVRFKRDGVVRLEEDEELRKYTYQVAGCVGEFWTELGFGLGEFAGESREQMDEWGRSYGRALQLINILRDVPEDLENGRCYLPGAEEVSPEVLIRERGRWIAEAHEGLDDAQRYAEALYGKRMRFATILPALIGRETLNRLEGASWEEWVARVKVSRAEVKGMMWDAVKFAV
ncbi:MAG: phytoene/squalene synthase family protein [Verrucomicrobiaceae bacterium]